MANARDYPPAPPAADPAPGADRYAGRPMDRPRAAARGETIQVQQGDTLYGISKRYGVSIAALIEVNGLAHGSTIKPGQQLVLPAGVIAAKPVPEQPAGRAPLARTPSAPPPATAPIATAGWEGRHTLKAGESLYSIARQHGVALAELQRVNGITEPTRVRAGTVLFGRRAESARASPSAYPPPAARPPGSAGHRRPAAHAQYAGGAPAALGDRSNDATAPTAEAARGGFRWPARAESSPASVSAPTTPTTTASTSPSLGTDIHAAESGRVAYAGNELKGYGNPAFIRHDNGWVSAYAHADQILVKRDDVVRRGQVIAKAGKPAPSISRSCTSSCARARAQKSTRRRTWRSEDRQSSRSREWSVVSGQNPITDDRRLTTDD